MQKKNYEQLMIKLATFQADDVITESVTDGIGVTYNKDKWGITVEEVFN